MRMWMLLVLVFAVGSLSVFAADHNASEGSPKAIFESSVAPTSDASQKSIRVDEEVANVCDLNSQANVRPATAPASRAPSIYTK